MVLCASCLAFTASILQLKFYLPLDLVLLLGTECVPCIVLTRSRLTLGTSVFIHEVSWHHWALLIRHGILWSGRGTC